MPQGYSNRVNGFIFHGGTHGMAKFYTLRILKAQDDVRIARMPNGGSSG